LLSLLKTLFMIATVDFCVLMFFPSKVLSFCLEEFRSYRHLKVFIRN
jgi:hypothetical protein